MFSASLRKRNTQKLNQGPGALPLPGLTAADPGQSDYPWQTPGTTHVQATVSEDPERSCAATAQVSDARWAAPQAGLPLASPGRL